MARRNSTDRGSRTSKVLDVRLQAGEYLLPGHYQPTSRRAVGQNLSVRREVLSPVHQEGNAPVDSWEPELLRLTGFTTGEVDGESWWPEVAATPIEEETKNLREGTYQASGPLTGDDGSENVLTLRLTQGRVDWLQKPREEPENPLWRTMGSLESALPAFIALMQPWLSRVDADFSRLALGVIARRTVESRESGYRILSQYLPFDLPASATDLMYRINRPRASRALGDSTLVNRLQTWSVVALKLVRVTIAIRPNVTEQPAADVASPSSLEHACRLELDISTAAEREGLLPRGRRTDVLAEFAELALEIANQGDIP